MAQARPTVRGVSTGPWQPLSGSALGRVVGWKPFLVGAAGTIVCAAWSWSPSYWSDEVATLRAARLSLPALITFVQHKDAVHALYYCFMHLWIAVLGQSEFALRLPSAIAVGIAAAGLVRLGAAFHDQRLGMVAALLFIILPRTTFMGVEARSYAMTAMMAVWATVLLIRCSERARFGSWAAYSAMIALSSYLFAYTLLIVPVHLIYLVFAHKPRRVISLWAVSVIIAGVLAAPLLGLAAAQKHQIDWLSTQPVVNAWTILVVPFFDSSWATAALFLVLVAVALSVRRLRVRIVALPQLPLAAAWAIVPMLVLLAANIIDGPLYLARYLSFCAPGAALLLASCLHSVRRRWMLIAAVVLVCCVSLPTYISQRGPFAKNGGSDLSVVAAYFDHHSRPGDAVFFEETGPAPLRPRLALYAFPDSFRDDSDIALVKPFNETGRWNFQDETAPITALGAKLRAHPRLWYVRPGRATPCTEGTASAFLQRNHFELVARSATHRETICEFIR